MIDTMGFDDPSKDHDAEIIAELVHKLHKGCDYVHLFVIAVNGQNPRLDGSLVSMTKIFEGMLERSSGTRLLSSLPGCPIAHGQKVQIQEKQRRGRSNR